MLSRRIVPFVLLVLIPATALVLPRVFAQNAAPTSPNPVVSAVLQQLGDRSPDEPFMLLVELKIKPGTRADLFAAIKAASVPTRNETANVRYQLLADPTDETLFQLSEEWKNVDGLTSHLEQPYLVKLLADFDAILAEPPELRVLVPAM